MAEDEATVAGANGIGEADATQLAAMVGQVSDEQLAEGMSDPKGRKLVLDEIFARMADHAQRDQLEGVDAVVHFKITEAPGGGEDVYEAVIAGGDVKVNDEPTSDRPRLTIIAAPVPFLKLVTGQESGPVMFMTGKLRIEGDVMFASRMTSFFRVPTASG
jgi:putative sterol carrier protein